MKWDKLVTLISVVFLLSGCISNNYYHYEVQASSATISKDACSTRWPEDIKVYERSKYLFFTNDWVDTSDRNPLNRINSDSIQREIKNQCAADQSTKINKLTVSVYYLTDINRVLFWGVTAPLVLGSTFTAGLLPVYSKDSAYLCLDMKLEDGSHRYGLSDGNIIVVVNIFGLLQDQKNGAPIHAAVRAHQRNLKILDKLLVNAYYKAWGPNSDLPQSNCKATLNAIVE